MYHAFYNWVIFHWTDFPHFVCPFIRRWIFGLLPVWIFAYGFGCSLVFCIVIDSYLQVESLGRMTILYLNCWRTTELFSSAAMPFYTLTNSVWDLQLVNILTNACHFQFFAIMPMKWYRYGFCSNVHVDQWCWASFRVFVDRFYKIFGKMSILVLSTFFNLVVHVVKLLQFFMYTGY